MMASLLERYSSKIAGALSCFYRISSSGITKRVLRRALPEWSSSQVSRLLKRLRIHGVIKKIRKAYKYYFTQMGRRVIFTALLGEWSGRDNLVARGAGARHRRHSHRFRVLEPGVTTIFRILSILFPLPFPDRPLPPP
jgi:hypothetical protein